MKCNLLSLVADMSLHSQFSPDGDRVAGMPHRGTSSGIKHEPEDYSSHPPAETPRGARSRPPTAKHGSRPEFAALPTSILISYSNLFK